MQNKFGDAFAKENRNDNGQPNGDEQPFAQFGERVKHCWQVLGVVHGVSTLKA